jgi:hypothetical protein
MSRGCDRQRLEDRQHGDDGHREGAIDVTSTT